MQFTQFDSLINLAEQSPPDLSVSLRCLLEHRIMGLALGVAETIFRTKKKTHKDMFLKTDSI